MTLQQAYDLAVQHHQSGRLAEAERLYRQILAVRPAHAESLHYLGIIACQMGRNDVGIDLIRQAIALRPDWPQACFNLGRAFHDAGQLSEAIAAYRQAIVLRPGDPESHSSLGAALRDIGNRDEAIIACQRAITLRPNFAEAYNNLGNVLKDKDQFAEAVISYRQAIAHKRNFPDAHNNLGVALKEAGHLDDAIAAYREAIVLKPDYAEALSNLGNGLAALGRLDEAIAACRRAIALRPELSAAHCNLGTALKLKGASDEAIAAFRSAIALNPTAPEALNNLGVALKETGKSDDAIAAYNKAIAARPDFAEAFRNLSVALHDKGCFDEALTACSRAIAIDPGYAEAHHNLALMLLLRGDFAAGWTEHEWRWQVKDFPSRRWNCPQPQWDGSDLAGRTLLVYVEQGYGDTVQFIRYVPLAANRCAQVIVACQPELHRLLRAVRGIAQLLATGDPQPSFDVICPLMSMPLAFGTSLQTIPRDVPYLKADTEGIERWRQRLDSPHCLISPSPHHALKIGLAWAGSPKHRKDLDRSIPLSALAPLAGAPNVRFFSLQTGHAAEQAANPPAGMTLVDWTDDLHDLADTAALIANLDLIISVDTAVAHLAGALGKLVWTLLPAVPDWRWLLDREDSPWYPTMRLFRQTSPGEWASVVDRVADALQLCREQLMR